MTIYFSYNRAIRAREEAEKNSMEDSMAEISAMDAVHQHIISSSNETFKVIDLQKVYQQKLSDFGVHQSSHITRFVEKLKIADCGVTPIQKEGKTIHYAIRKETFQETATSSHDWFKMLRRVIKPIRQEIIDCKKEVDMTALEWTGKSGGSMKLKILLTMLCEDNPRIYALSKPLSSLVQLISLNTKKSAKSEFFDLGSVTRHLREDFVEISQYLSLKLYTIIRAENLIQAFFHYGILLSPKTISTFFDELTPSVIKLFKDSDGKVLPSNVRLGIFSVVIDDNLDENSQSPTSKHNFHGSSISIIQFPTAEKTGTCRKRVPYQELSEVDRKIDTSVVDKYSTIQPVAFSLKNSHYPIQTVCIPEEFTKKLEKSYSENFLEELRWSTKVADVIANLEATNEGNKFSWTAHHAEIKRSEQKEISISAVLPLIDHASHTVEFQYHVMSMAKDYTAYINPSQATVGCSDQPLYAIKKKIQWARPLQFPLTHYFPFFGGLHVEQALLKIHGQLVTGTGIDDVIGLADLPTVGLKNALCNVSDIKKARYTVQIMACCLSRCLCQSFEEAGKSDVSLNDWAELQDASMFRYFYGILKFEFNILMVVRSFREGNIDLLIASLKKALGLCFALDHYNYARWLSVFVQDLEVASVYHPDDNNNLFRDISNHLSVKSTNSTFNGVSYDQKHENNNKYIKSTGGYIDLVNRDDKSQMRKLEICLPEVLQYLDRVEGKTKKTKHKEELDTFSKKFVEDSRKVFSKISTNPFVEDSFVKLNSPVRFPDVIVQDCAKVFLIGDQQYHNFVSTRFIFGTEDVVNSSIPKNNLKLPSSLSSVAKIDSPQIKFSPTNLTKIRDACIIRVGLGRQLFDEEFTRVPECMFKDGEAYHNNKSDLLELITPTSAVVERDMIDAEGLVVDLSAVIRSNAPFVSTCPDMTYSMFAKKLLTQIEQTAVSYGVSRLDIVQDKYFIKSIKNAMRSTRGRGVRVRFEEDDRVTKEFKSFIENSDNKTDLNNLISEHAARETTWQWGGEVFVTFGKGVKSTLDGPVDMMRFCDEVHEEADGRIIVHIAHMLDHQISKIIVRTGDTDVIIIMLGFMSQFLFKNESTEIWVDFGMGSSRKMLDLNRIYEHVGESISLALPFFHSFTGSDSTASFFGKSKKFWYDLWMKLINEPEDITSAFTQLSWLPTAEILEENFQALQNFVVAAYNPKEPEMTLGETRYNLFIMSAKMDLRLLPPSKKALKMHILRSSYQAGWIWGNVVSQRAPPDATSWGWTMSHSDNRLQVLWQPPEVDSSSSNALVLLLKSCKCSGERSKCTVCNCGKLKLPCINPCSCNRKCMNVQKPVE